ncbi:DUF418 domain-containing protein [Tropicibacter sp. Alg240-R139]|uniref:DUF418 domain-containing protein n=1 Tax=Tropicibacter sp. Alg240-R139 TaxID=2305991 RepID=UPI001F080537|nr:DUF418 domain-containing protein [Tropicibacter sp. Alg240-R139]
MATIDAQHKPRLHGLDAARFLAFCGMVLVNFRIAAEVAPGTDWANVLINSLEGRAAALFVVLAGIGVTLGQPSPWPMAKRAGFLFVIGMANMTIFDADILHFYALYFLVAIPFLTSSSHTLWIGASGIVVASVLAHGVLDYDTGWDWDTLVYTDLWTVSGFLRNALFNGWHPVLPWAAFLLIGMALGRSDLGARCIQHRLILWGLAAALFALVPQFLIQDPDLRALLGTESIPPGPFYILAGTGTACAAIGLTLKFIPTLDGLHLSATLTAPGKQALTLYVAHILIGMGTLEELDLLDGSLTAPQIIWIGLGFAVATSVFAMLWSRVFRRGPLEAIMRKVTG